MTGRVRLGLAVLLGALVFAGASCDTDRVLEVEPLDADTPAMTAPPATAPRNSPAPAATPAPLDPIEAELSGLDAELDRLDDDVREADDELGRSDEEPIG